MEFGVNMKKLPLIKHVMTPFPYWVNADSTVADAKKLLDQHGIGHLPVKEGERHCNIIGIIAKNDVRVTEEAKSKGLGSPIEDLKVVDICTLSPYIVDILEPLPNVLVHMANHHIGSAIVTKEGRLAGVFTAHDACRTFADYLNDQFIIPSGNDVA